MENQSIKDSPKAKLPPLLSGSEYEFEDIDSHREANLLGLALAIVVQAQEDNLTMPQKNVFLSLFEAEAKKVVTYRKNVREFYRRHAQKYKSPDTGNEDFFQNMMLKWLKESLTEKAPVWGGLYKLIKIQVLMWKNGPTDWWEVVQSICKKAETAVDPFDPIAEIWRIAEEHPADDELVEESDRTQASGDEPQEKPGQLNGGGEAPLPVEASVGRKQKAGRTIAAIFISLIMVLLFELFVYIGPVSYVRNHPHTYGIQGSTDCLILCVVVGFFKPRLRKWCWGSAAIAFLAGLLSLL